MKTRKWWHRIAAKILAKFLRLYLWTLTIQMTGKDRAYETLSTSSKGCVFLFWHDSILLLPSIESATAIQPICLLISNSRDGDLVSEIGAQFGNASVIRVKHSSRASALFAGCKALDERKSLFITPDGPRGPRRQIKPGALFACQKSEAVILPVVWAASRQKTLSSWDRFRIPLPFSKVLLSFLEPVACPKEGDINEISREIEKKMDAEEQALTIKCGS